MKKVSVIVPVYNRKNLLERSLDSIASQTWRPLELIVVDNGSSDGSKEFASEWALSNSTPDFSIIVVSELKKGACHARNKGLSLATGDFCIFFDSDDRMRPNLIEKAVNEFIKYPEISVVCWKCEINQLNGSVRIPPFQTDNAIESHLVHTLLRTLGYMAPTELFLSVGGWDTTLDCWNDLELGARILLYIYGNEENSQPREKISGIPEVLVDVYSQENSITGKDFSSKSGLWEKSIAKIRQNLTCSTINHKDYLLKILAYKEMILAAHYKKENRPDLASGLLEKVFKESSLSVLQKWIFEILFHYTARGGRGAWKIAKPFLLPIG